MKANSLKRELYDPQFWLWRIPQKNAQLCGKSMKHNEMHKNPTGPIHIYRHNQREFRNPQFWFRRIFQKKDNYVVKIEKKTALSEPTYTGSKNVHLLLLITIVWLQRTLTDIRSKYRFWSISRLWPWSSWTANNDKKYMELNGAGLNVNKPCVISRKTAFPKDKTM